MNQIKLAIKEASGYSFIDKGPDEPDRYELSYESSGLLILAGLNTDDRFAHANIYGLSDTEAFYRLYELYRNWREVEIHVPSSTPRSKTSLASYVKEGGTYREPQPGAILFDGAGFVKESPERDALGGLPTASGLLYLVSGVILPEGDVTAVDRGHVNLTPPILRGEDY